MSLRVLLSWAIDLQKFNLIRILRLVLACYKHNHTNPGKKKSRQRDPHILQCRNIFQLIWLLNSLASFWCTLSIKFSKRPSLLPKQRSPYQLSSNPMSPLYTLKSSSGLVSPNISQSLPTLAPPSSLAFDMFVFTASAGKWNNSANFTTLELFDAESQTNPCSLPFDFIWGKTTKAKKLCFGSLMSELHTNDIGILPVKPGMSCHPLTSRAGETLAACTALAPGAGAGKEALRAAVQFELSAS